MTVAERREREKLERRESIMECARKLFEKNGLQATTVEEIAEQAELGKGTIYNYFLTKEDIYFQLLMQSLEQLIGELKEVLDTARGGDMIDRTVEVFARFHRRRHGLNEFLLLSIDDYADKLPTDLILRHEELLKQVLELLEELSVRLARMSDIELENPRDVALFLFAVEVGVSAFLRFQRDRLNGSVDAAGLWETAKEILLDGLTSDSTTARGTN